MRSGYRVLLVMVGAVAMAAYLYFVALAQAAAPAVL